jgi:hypothetical protein
MKLTDAQKNETLTRIRMFSAFKLGVVTRDHAAGRTSSEGGA